MIQWRGIRIRLALLCLFVGLSVLCFVSVSVVVFSWLTVCLGCHVSIVPIVPVPSFVSRSSVIFRSMHERHGAKEGTTENPKRDKKGRETFAGGEA